MNDFRPEDFDQAFGQTDAQLSQSENAITKGAPEFTLPRSGEEQAVLEFESQDAITRKGKLGFFQLRVVAFVIR